MSQSTNLTYQNNYENNFNNNFENNFSTMSQNEPDLQRFTATGRPMPGAEKIKQGAGMNAMAVSDSMGTATPNLLPFRYTDDSMLTIPVQPPPPYPESMLGGGSDDDGPIKEGKSKKRFSLSSMRRSSKSKKQPEFVMKEMTRGEYLKHYAKNEQGQYIGTEEPAADILFSDPSDYLKFRAHPQGYGKLTEHQQSGWPIAL